jgi:hypothetical protein
VSFPRLELTSTSELRGINARTRLVRGESIAQKIRDDYRAGRLKLRRYRWRVTDVIFALGRDTWSSIFTSSTLARALF